MLQTCYVLFIFFPAGDRGRLLDLLKPLPVSDEKQFDIVVPFDWLNSARDLTLHFGKFFPSSKFVVHEGGKLKQDTATGPIDNSYYMNGGTNRFDKYRFHAGLGKRSPSLLQNMFRHGLMLRSADDIDVQNDEKHDLNSDSVQRTNAIGDLLHDISAYDGDFDKVSKYIWRTMPHLTRRATQSK